MSAQQYFARIADAAGLDSVREHHGLAAGQNVALDGGGLELFQRILDAAKGIIGELGISLDDTTIAAVRAGMDLALDKAFELIDFPGPDVIVEPILRKVAHWGFDKAVSKIKMGS